MKGTIQEENQVSDFETCYWDLLIASLSLPSVSFCTSSNYEHFNCCIESLFPYNSDVVSVSLSES